MSIDVHCVWIDMATHIMYVNVPCIDMYCMSMLYHRVYHQIPILLSCLGHSLPEGLHSLEEFSLECAHEEHEEQGRPHPRPQMTTNDHDAFFLMGHETIYNVSQDIVSQFSSHVLARHHGQPSVNMC